MTGRVTVGLGVAMGVLGLVALVVPSLTTALPINDALVLLLGVVLLLGAVGQIQRRRSVEFEYAETPDTERAVELPTPGDGVDRRLDHLTLTRFNELERQRLREEVMEVTLDTVQRREGLSREAAEEALHEGTWTEDPFAAAFFTGGPPEASPQARMREFFSSTPPFKHRAVSAIDAVYGLAEGEDA